MSYNKRSVMVFIEEPLERLVVGLPRPTTDHLRYRHLGNDIKETTPYTGY